MPRADAEQERIAIIGGGWAGLAAAVELVTAGKKITLFEAGRQFGGRTRSITLDGRRLDNGQHILLGAYRETLALMRRVGADPERLLQRLPLNIQDNTGFRLQLPRLPAPLNLAWGLLTARGVSLREKFNTALWMERLKTQNFRLAVDCSVAEWLDAADQKGALRHHLWEPLCLAALNTPAELASAQVFANTLRDSLGSPHRANTDLLLSRVDLGQLLPEPASKWLATHGADLRTSHRVQQIEPSANALNIDGEIYSQAILATAPQHAATLLGDECHFQFEPITTIYLAYSSDTHLPCHMLGQQGGIGQWAIDRGDGLIACVLSGHGKWEETGDDELASALADELALGSTPHWHGVVREKRATFSCRPNLHRPDPATRFPRLWLAGDYTWADYPGTLEGAVRSGLRAAGLCLGA